MGLQLANVTRDRKDLFNALAKAYAEIYTPAFPDDNERESLEKMHRVLNGETPGVEIIINVAGENLTSADPIVKGIGVAYYYHPQNVGLLAYNAVSPDSKGEGIGKTLVHSRIESLKQMAISKNSKLRAVFVDCNNPDKVDAQHDSMDPTTRIKVFTSWGAREIPLNYVQPPLEDHLEYCDNMTLFNYPVDGKYAGPRETQAYLEAIFKESLPHQNLKLNMEYQRMSRELKKWHPANENKHCAVNPLLKKMAAAMVFV